MENLIALGIFILLVVFIFSVGSKILRFIGILLLALLIWIFRAEIMSQANELARAVQSENFWAQAKQFVVEVWHNVVRWFGNLVN